MRTLGWPLGLLSLVLVAGCGSDPEVAEPEAAGVATEEAAEPDEAEHLRIAVPADVGPLNIFGQHEEHLTELVYDKLLAPSPYVDEPRPWLAEEVTELDPSTWEVTVRSDVAWHDGEPFTAADVAFTMAYFREAPTGRWTHHVDEVPDFVAEAIDDQTVRLECSYPCPDLGAVTLADLPILPAHVWEGVAEPREESSLPVGTGPYELVEYDQSSGYRFEANEDYFAGPAVVDELEMPVIEDPSTTFTALRTGEIDAAARPVSPELLEEFEADDAIEVATTAALQFPELRLNFEEQPFDVGELRRALSLALDREALVESVALGQGRPSTQGYPHPDSPWTNPDLTTPSDATEARALLDEIGFTDQDGDGRRQMPDGTPIDLEIKVAGSEPTHVRAGELLVESFADVGLTATLRQLDAGSISDLFRSRDFDAYITTITAHGVADPTQLIMSHRSGYLWDYPRVAYPEWGELWEQWEAADTVEARTDISFEMQALLNRRPTAIPLYYPDEHWAFRPEAYTGWAEARGYGIVHKWSFLPREVAEDANALVAPMQ